MPLTALRHRLSRFGRDRRGVSAVEFALLAPLMIGLYLSGVELSEGISIDRKVTLTAGTLANLAAQNATLSSSDMTNILNASAAIMAPYSRTPLKIVLSCIDIDKDGKAAVQWSETYQGTKRGIGDSVTLPSALAVPNTALVLSEVTYAYRPVIGHTITGTLNLSDKMYMGLRQLKVTYDNKECV
jgi:Flp pilus assembly protein TadG